MVCFILLSINKRSFLFNPITYIVTQLDRIEDVHTITNDSKLLSRVQCSNMGSRAAIIATTEDLNITSLVKLMTEKFISLYEIQILNISAIMSINRLTIKTEYGGYPNLRNMYEIGSIISMIPPTVIS